jgi:outer membrane lipoprotein SlyB
LAHVQKNVDRTHKEQHMKKATILSLTATVFAVTLATSAAARCDNCGTVTSTKSYKVKGQGTGVGAVTGGILGGVVGHQVGGGRGKDVATVAGAAGGAYLGHQTERNVKASMRYQVVVKLESGQTRTFTYRSPTSYRIGDRIKVEQDKLLRL